jgi:hypothetical protein
MKILFYFLSLDNSTVNIFISQAQGTAPLCLFLLLPKLLFSVKQPISFICHNALHSLQHSLFHIISYLKERDSLSAHLCNRCCLPASSHRATGYWSYFLAYSTTCMPDVFLLIFSIASFYKLSDSSQPQYCTNYLDSKHVLFNKRPPFAA